MLFDQAAAVPLWPHQRVGVQKINEQIRRGVRRICFQCPTGGGKSRIMQVLTASAVAENCGVSIYTNRKLLQEQLSRDFAAAGISHGLRVADKIRAPHHPVQLCSVQTEHSRVMRRKRWDLHPSGLVLVDEAHVNSNPQCNRIIDQHLANGAAVVGFTATPIGIGDRYDALVQSGLTSELRACGALVPARHFGCEEPDLRHIRSIPKMLDRDLTGIEQVKAIMTPGIFGRVIQWYRLTNPHGAPSIGFGPGVSESIGFRDAFDAAGIPAAHIDGSEIIFPGGIRCQSTPEARDRLAEMSRSGEARIVWNRFVLREGISWNWLAHGVLACVFGTLQSYIQSGGRLLRAHPGLECVTIQDHGGNWWRHGSLNADRVWELGDTHASVAGRRWDLFDPIDPATPPAPEPFLCASCKQVLMLTRTSRGVVTCPGCKREIDLRRKGRTVVQHDGALVEMDGSPFYKRPVDNRPDTVKLWRSIYFRCKRADMTFRQAYGLFQHEHRYCPPRTLELMPLNAADWYRKITSVPTHNLRTPTPENL